MHKSWNSLRAASLAMLLAASGGSEAQPTKWPLRPVRIVVPFSVGSGTDLTTRIVAEKLAGRWGQPIIVDNKPGAAGIIGVQDFKKSPPDAHDFLMGSNGELSANPHVYAKLPYDVERDFEAIVYVFRVPFVFFVSTTSDIKSLMDLVRAAKAQPGKLSYASSGTASPMQLGTELFNVQSGLQMLHVPFKGAAQLLPAVASGEVTTMLLSYNTGRPLVELGRLRPLAVTSTTRLRQRADVPTAAEAGVPVVYESWGTLVGLKGLPPAIVDRVNADINEVLKLPEVRERFNTIGFEITGGSAAEAAELIRQESVRMRDVVLKAGIKAGQ